MKLLRDFYRLCAAGTRTAPGRGAIARDIHVTVPAALDQPGREPAAVVELARAVPSPTRREPASFLKTPRRRRIGASRA